MQLPMPVASRRVEADDDIENIVKSGEIESNRCVNDLEQGSNAGA